MKVKKKEPINLACSFCGKTQDEVKKLIAGPTVFICDECIELCGTIIREEIINDLSLAKSALALATDDPIKYLDLAKEQRKQKIEEKKA